MDMTVKSAIETAILPRAKPWHRLLLFISRHIGIFAAAFATLVLALVAIGSFNVKEAYQQTLVSEALEDNVKSARALAIRVHDEITFFQSISEHVKSGIALSDAKTDTVTNVSDVINGFSQHEQFGTLGFITPDGKAFLDDGSEYHTGYEAIYGGESRDKITLTTISNPFSAAMRTSVIVRETIYSPKNEVLGVLFMIFDDHAFRTVMSLHFEHGFEGCYLIDNNGEVIYESNDSSHRARPMFFESLIERNQVSRETVATLRDEIAQGRNGIITFADEDSTYYLGYSPVRTWTNGSSHNKNNWMVVSVFSEEKFTTLSNSVLYDLVRTNIIAVIVTLFAAAILLRAFIEHRREIARELERKAYEDYVTGGNNYAGFVRDLKESRRSGFLVSANIRSFANVRLFCGEERSDAVICRIWERITAQLSSKDLAGHLYSDTFIIFIAGKSTDVLTLRLSAIRDAVAMLQADLHLPPVQIYFGATEWSVTSDVEISVSEAVRARHNCLFTKGHFFCLFSRNDAVVDREDREMIEHFDESIKNKEFEVWFQPKYDANSRDMVAAEALVRWRHKGKLVPPDRFIGLFERNGLISVLDEATFTRVCEFQRERLDRGLETVPVSINISRVGIYRPNLVETYTAIAEEYRVDSRHIALEITESSSLKNDEIVGVVKAFYKAGFAIHLDDFGKENSSLSALSVMPLDTLKLDKSLIDQIGTLKGALTIKHTVALCKEMRLTVTAEGVENEYQYDFLRHLGCDSIQGYFFCRPVPADVFAGFLNDIAGAPVSRTDHEGIELISREKMSAILQDEITTTDVSGHVQKPVAFYQIRSNVISLLSVNEAYCDLLGVGRKSLINEHGNMLIQKIYRDDRDIFMDVFKRAMTAGNGGAVCEVRYIREDGTVIWCEVTAYYLRHWQDTDQFYATIRNVTQAHDQVTLLRNAVSMSRVNVWYWDKETRTLTIKACVNPNRRHPGIDFLDREKTVITNFPDSGFGIKDFDQLESTKSFFAALCSGEMRPPYTYDAKLTDVEGNDIWLCFKGRCIADENGNLKFITGVFFEISDKAAEETHTLYERHRKLISSEASLFVFDADLTENRFINTHYTGAFAAEYMISEKTYTEQIMHASQGIILTPTAQEFLDFLNRERLIELAKQGPTTQTLKTAHLWRGNVIVSTITIDLSVHPLTQHVMLSITNTLDNTSKEKSS